jgi:hypothetical protein
MASKRSGARERRPVLDGIGRWSKEAILGRYRHYCRVFRLHPRPLQVPEAFADRDWINPLMRVICDGIRAGDLACAEIEIELIKEDGSFAFGLVMKCDAARALS